MFKSFPRFEKIHFHICKTTKLQTCSQNCNLFQKNQIFSSPAYSVAKGGIISLTKYLAAYWGNRNIRVNCVSPGGIYNKSENKIFLRNYSKKVPMKRKARVEEVCDSIIFLSSDESSYINGHNLIVDGGFTAW